MMFKVDLCATACLQAVIFSAFLTALHKQAVAHLILLEALRVPLFAIKRQKGFGILDCGKAAQARTS
jgi:hypothetical protein